MDIDSGGAHWSSLNISSVGTGAAGIGEIAIYPSGTSANSWVDNFEYDTKDYAGQTWKLVDNFNFTGPESDSGVLGAPCVLDQNKDLAVREAGSVFTGLNVDLTLQNYSANDWSLSPVKVDVIDSTGTVVATQTVTQYFDANDPLSSAYLFAYFPEGVYFPNGGGNTNPLVAGNYLVRAYACKWLSTSTTATVVDGQLTDVSLTLPNGDIDGNGTIGITDYSILSNNYGKTGN